MLIIEEQTPLVDHQLFNNFSINLNTTLSSLNDSQVSDKETSTIRITTQSLQRTKDSIINTPFWIAALIMISLLTLIGLVTVLRKHYEAEIQKCNPFKRKNIRDLNTQEEIEMNGVGDGTRRTSLSHMHFGLKIGDVPSSSKRSSGTPSNVGSPTPSHGNRRHSIISYCKRRLSNDTSVSIEPSHALASSSSTQMSSNEASSSSAVQRFYMSLNQHVIQMKKGIRRESGSSSVCGPEHTDDETQAETNHGAIRMARALTPDEIQCDMFESNAADNNDCPSISMVNNVIIELAKDDDGEEIVSPHSNEDDQKTSSTALSLDKRYLDVPDYCFSSNSPEISISSTNTIGSNEYDDQEKSLSTNDSQVKPSKNVIFARNRSFTLRTDSMTTRSNTSSTKPKKIKSEFRSQKEHRSRRKITCRSCSTDCNLDQHAMIDLKYIKRVVDHLARQHEHQHNYTTHPRKSSSSKNRISPSSHSNMDCLCAQPNVHRSASFCAHIADVNFSETQTQHDFRPHGSRPPKRFRRTKTQKRSPMNKSHSSRETLLGDDDIARFGEENQCACDELCSTPVAPTRQAVETWVEEQSKTIATIECDNIEVKTFQDGAMIRSSSTIELPSVNRVYPNRYRYPFVKSYSMDLLLNRENQDTAEEALDENGVQNFINSSKSSINKNFLRVPEIPSMLLDFECQVIRLPPSEGLDTPIFAADMFIYVNDWTNKSTESLTAIDRLTNSTDISAIKGFGETRKLSDTSDSAIQPSEPSTSSDENPQRLKHRRKIYEVNKSSSPSSSRHMLHRQSHLQRLMSNSSTSSHESSSRPSQIVTSHANNWKKINDSAYQTKENSTDRGFCTTTHGGRVSPILSSSVLPRLPLTNKESTVENCIQENLKLVAERLQGLPSPFETDASLIAESAASLQSIDNSNIVNQTNQLLPSFAITLLPEELSTFPSSSYLTQKNAFQRKSLNSHLRLMSQVSEEQVSETETDSNRFAFQNSTSSDFAPSRDRILQVHSQSHFTSFGKVSENGTEQILHHAITKQATIDEHFVNKFNVFTHLLSKYQGCEKDFEEVV